MVDATSQGEKSLEGIGNVGFNLLRRHAGIKRRHDHYGDIDVGKEVHRHAYDGRHANHRDDKAQHDDEEWVSNREAGHAYCAPRSAVYPSSAIVLSLGSTCCPGRYAPRLPTITRSPSFNPDRI